MPRKFLKRYMPTVEKVREIRVLHLFGDRLFHPALWHLNRRSAAGGVALGLFCGLIPGPMQMLGGGIAAIFLRVNLPLALVTTLYTNPITIVPLYLVAYQIGSFVVGTTGSHAPESPPHWVFSQPMASLQAFSEWTLSLGTPLVLGIFLLASLLSAVGYTAVRVGWNIYLRRAWAQRRTKRSHHQTGSSRP